MKFHRALTYAIAVIPTSLALSACADHETVSDQKSFPLGGNRLTIVVPSSNLEVVPGRGPGVQVRRWLGGTPAKPGNSSWSLDGDTLRLRINCSGLVLKCDSRFRVAVPPNVSLLVNSGDGRSTVSGFTRPVVIKSTNGRVNVRNVSGPLRIRTRTGRVTVSGVRSPSVHATSGDGDVTIRFATAPRLVDIKSGTGDLKAEVPVSGHTYRVSVSSGTGNARSDVPDNTGSTNTVKLSSRNGNATVLPTSGNGPN
ncbi:DUF4097 family beta strand repeat-containing protein [Actinomadura adrarensis]|uniref:DUF4097 family beta strand repeat-containing protein n=1 Tax=Actinomadura adrarensis TaxID=1819600 RepID=A0ABW3CQ32_9ACTN